MSRIVFYCNDDKSFVNDTEYYKQDIDALRALGHEVVVCTKYREIPLHFDAMFIWWWTYALWPVLLCRMLRRPCIITGVYNFRFPATFAGTDYFKRPRWQQFVLTSATRLCTMNLFIDEKELAACTRHFNLRNARHYPCTVHEDYLQGPAVERETVLFNLAWTGKQNLQRKGIPDLVRAVRLLKDENVSVSLKLAGHPGDGTTFLLDLIEQLEVPDRVTWLGPLSRADKIALLRTCEIYVQPSHYEGFGLATAEAMGCGACVITCDVGAVGAVVGDCGIYVSPGSPSELASAIKRAVGDDEMRHRLQRAANERARKLFAADAKLARLESYLFEMGIS